MGGVEKRKIIFFKKTAIILGLLFLAVFLISPVFAQTPPLDLGLDYAKATGLANTDIRMIIAKIIRAALGLVGIVMIGFIIYAGWMYMTSGGNEEKVETAKRILKNLVIGLAIILSALGIVQFVIQMLYDEYLSKVNQEAPSGYSEEFFIGGFLGQVIESHYPKRNAPWEGEQPIPRNTKIAVTFREAVDPASLIEDTNQDGIYGNYNKDTGVADQINSQNIKIYPTAEKSDNALGSNVGSDVDDVYITLSSDGRTIVMKPKNYLGNFLNEVKYTVFLGTGIKWKNSKPLFPGSNPYYWEFTVSPVVDLTPPKVQSIIPLPATLAYQRNIIVQINFDEAVDPISASGLFKTDAKFLQGELVQEFNNITIVSPTPTGPITVNGEYKIANQYKTVEFISFDECGKNPCGAPIFCLPPSSMLNVTVKAATFDLSNPPQASIFNLDGVVDMANNSLNGGGELKLVDNQVKLVPGIKEKNEWDKDMKLDNFWWEFSTSEQIKTTPPFLTEVQPSVDKPGVDDVAPLTMTFDSPMSASSFNKIFLKTNKLFNVWYTPAANYFTDGGSLVDEPTDKIAYTQAELLHGAFWKMPAEPKTEDEKIASTYFPFVPSEVTDIFQNCFYKAEGPGCSLTDLKDPNRSCYNGAPYNSTSTCASKESYCPFNPPPKP